LTQKTYPRELELVIRFHGHFCGGILIGYRAAKVGLQRLIAKRAEDEQLVAIVENDSCAVDAVQVVTGCTFGKGNLFFRDYGKHVYTFALRPSGRAVRVSRRPDKHLSHEEMLSAPPEELFWIEETQIELPAPARIFNSVNCGRCGEPVMETRTRRRAGRTLCIPCAQRSQEDTPRPPLRGLRQQDVPSDV
jgi:formylmethanofuran dehydrogenase subunit E